MNIRQSGGILHDRFYTVKSDILGIFVITILSWNFTYGLEQVLDIKLYDESLYLWHGVTLSTNGLAARAPLYTIWYYLLSLLNPDRIELYYLNHKILNLLPALLLYVFLRVQRVRVLVAVCAACLLVVSQGNLPTWPKVSHFALSILLGGLTIASLVTSPTLIFGILSLTALVASYIRPEYFLAFLIFAFISCLIKFRQKQTNPQYISLFIVATIAVLLLVTLGLPMGRESGRSFLAFQQHFSLNWVQWTQSDLNPWTNSRQIIHKCFGNSDSTIRCALYNPALMTKHVLSNLLSFPQKAITFLLYPARHDVENFRYFKLLIVHMLLLIAMGILALGKFRLVTIKSTWPLVSTTVVATTILAVPPLLSSALIYPRDHYLLLLVVLFFASFLILARDCNLQPKRGVLLLILLFGALFLLQTPVRFKPPERMNIVRAIDFLDSLSVHQNVHLLEAEGGLNCYLSTNWSRVAEYEKSESFRAFMKRRNINAVMLTDRLMNDSRLRSDSEWLDFISKPQDWGFDKIAVPGTPWQQLLIQHELLSQNGKRE